MRKMDRIVENMEEVVLAVEHQGGHG